MKWPHSRVASAVLSIALVILVVVILGTIDRHSALRRLDDFDHRVGQILPGMSEEEVRAVAGQPDVPAVTDQQRIQECGHSNVNAVIAYSVGGGWVSDLLGWPSGTWTVVVCLDNRKRVIKTYSEMVHI